MAWRMVEDLLRNAGEFKRTGSHYKINCRKGVHMDWQKKMVIMEVIRFAEERLYTSRAFILTDW